MKQGQQFAPGDAGIAVGFFSVLAGCSRAPEHGRYAYEVDI
jgi:hypothetical protein